MSGLGLTCLVTSCFTNATYSYVGLWIVIFAVCLAAERALCSAPASRHTAEPQRVPCLTPVFTSLLQHGKGCQSAGKPVCTHAALKEKTL